jgi:TonB family protein
MGQKNLTVVILLLIALVVGFMAGKVKITKESEEATEVSETAEMQQTEKHVESRKDASLPTPVPLHTVAPEYPESAKSEGIQGTVFVKLLVDTTGHVAEAEVLKSAHPDLDKAAVEAARQWEFEVAEFVDRPVQQYVVIPVKFALD